MRRISDPGQCQTRLLDRRVLLLSAVVAAVAADWFLLSAPPAPRTPISNQIGPHGQPLVADRQDSDSARLPADVPPQPPPARSNIPMDPPPPVSLLEAQFRAAQAKDERIDLAGQIADWNNASAIQALYRLFTSETHPDVKLALITDLNDTNPQAAPETRLALLSSALRDQPRNIRAAALASLAQIDDPRVEPILKQTMSKDPDQKMRDQAAAIYRALYAGSEP